jgi:protein-L-isoaspartate(D-aspartate) O-methyltransferase
MHRALKLLFCSLLFGFSVCPLPTAAAGADDAQQRLEMVRTIEQYSRFTSDFVGDDGLSPKVLDAMRTVKRHLFIPKRHQSMAYDDRPVEIGHGQTISQPFIVALMTHLLEPEPDDVVLEIGTGSGYQAAVLSPLVRKVCTIEIITELGEAAAEHLAAQGYGNVETKIADGYHGWPECGPFDGIVVTAAADHVPPPLVDQLKPGGRMVIPVGGMFATQHLTLVEKTGSGEVLTRQILPVRFVPFTRGVQ